MLKKMIILLGILMLLIPISVNAAKFEDGATKYTLEEVKISHDVLKNNVTMFVGMDGSYYIFQIMDGINMGKYYRATEDKCVPMTNQEVLDFLKKHFSSTNIDIDGYDLYLVEEIYNNFGYLKATSYNNTETYYEWNETESRFVEVTTSSEAELENYYVGVYVTIPDSATINNNTTYYTMGNGNRLTKVENPDAAQILNYWVIVDESKVSAKTKIKTLDNNVFADLFANGDVFLCSYNKETGKMFLTAVNFEDGQYYVYDLDGNLLKDVYHIEAYSNSLYGTVYNDGTFKILNEDMEAIYEDKTTEYSEQSYSNYINYLMGHSQSGFSFNHLYTYKLLSKDNQTYNNKDLKIEFSGQRDRIKAITVNGKTLNKSNYSLSGTLTTITLKKAYLNTLLKGEYTLQVEYVDGVKLTSTFKKTTNPALDNTPATGNLYSSVVVLSGIATISLIGLTSTVVYSRKKY